LRIGRIGAVKDGAGEDGPGNCGTEKDETDCGDTFAHFQFSLKIGTHFRPPHTKLA
jgi:hypothetical protein